MVSPKISVVVESTLESVPLAGILVRTFCLESGMSGVESGQMEVCVMEAANNCVSHAYQGMPGQVVEVVARRQADEFQFEVWDRGTPMNPQILQRSRRQLLDLQPNKLDTAPECGRGLAIIEAIMDEVEYATEDGRNRFSMTKRISCASPKS